MSHLKLSFHGDDPRHPVGGGFKIAIDDEGYRRAIAEGELLSTRSGIWPIWFPGQEVAEDAVLVTRMRWTWDACTRLGPALSPGELRRDATGMYAPVPPKPGDAVDVDLIVSAGRPYWPQETKARRDNACLGPLKNEADQWLTGTVVKRTASHRPPPDNAIGPRPTSSTDEVRAVGAAVDSEGFLWMVEQRMSRSALEAASALE
ncbi:hypothetical protein EV646_104225 [Kribbella antiqua]|uniref:Uncharacterized protein n=1 Tax=Kribbella antiqua TaxID=2512217 RepID=A0A4R2ITJ0_9ACTN|nr:hypothetical protein [Kribbella antiqua]TCO48407.1 hypothetical protein EV646_104225 [Kribbella antiqua]